MINFGAIVAFILVAYEISNVLKGTSEKKKFAGSLVNKYKHKSALKKFGLILLITTPPYAYGMYVSADVNMVIGFMLVVFAFLFFLRTRKDIEEYENGVFILGKFTKWEDIDSVVIGKRETLVLVSNKPKVRPVEIDKVADLDEVAKHFSEKIKK